MKVFIPITDALLSDRGELSGVLVPFTPDLLVNRVKQNRKQKPDHWIPAHDLQSAMQRLGSKSNPPS